MTRAEDEQQTATTSLGDLPDGILGAILDCLDLVDRQRVSFTCRRLRERVRTLSALLTHIDIESRHQAAVLRHLLLMDCLVNLVQLDLQSFATDDILLRMGACRPLRHLRSLSMVGSLGISDHGLACLAMDSSSFKQTLESVDITYCHNTTYGGTFPLRDVCPGLRLLRRQPAWMDGRFETPFDNDGLHTYYADGSFKFERQHQSCGYVMHVEPWDAQADPYHVFDKLQYNNADMPEFWPDWARFLYRPGVSLLRLDNDDDDKQVLVAQKLRGLRPPRECPRPEHAALLPQPKSSVHLNRQGRVVPADHPDRYYLLSRMRVFPLKNRMPPTDLVERNRAFCHQLRIEQLTFGTATEDVLHVSLGGD